MQCSEYQELISAYIDDELSKNEIKKLLVHFDHCLNCKEVLSTFTLQKEGVSALRSSYLGPVPGPEFPQTVMAEINKQISPSKTINVYLSLLNSFHSFLSFIKKPAFALSFSFLIVIGIVTGTLWESVSPNKNQKKLLSVYELQDNRNRIPKENVTFTKFEREEHSILFHHIAHSSVGTFATMPCLLEYAAYTSVSEHN